MGLQIAQPDFRMMADQGAKPVESILQFQKQQADKAAQQGYLGVAQRQQALSEKKDADEASTRELGDKELAQKIQNSKIAGDTAIEELKQMKSLFPLKKEYLNEQTRTMFDNRTIKKLEFFQDKYGAVTDDETLARANDLAVRSGLLTKQQVPTDVAQARILYEGSERQALDVKHLYEEQLINKAFAQKKEMMPLEMAMATEQMKEKVKLQERMEKLRADLDLGTQAALEQLKQKNASMQIPGQQLQQNPTQEAPKNPMENNPGYNKMPTNDPNAQDILYNAREFLAAKTGFPNTIQPGHPGGVPVNAAPAQSSSVQYRADGGPVEAGQPYIVGERGPEMIVPDQSGTVIPNERMQMADASGMVDAAAASQQPAQNVIPTTPPLEEYQNPQADAIRQNALNELQASQASDTASGPSAKAGPKTTYMEAQIEAKQAIAQGTLDKVKSVLFDKDGEINQKNLLNAKLGTFRTDGRTLQSLMNMGLRGNLRAETGAAIGDKETEAELQALMPDYNDKEELNRIKWQAYKTLVNKAREFNNPGTIKQDLRNGISESLSEAIKREDNIKSLREKVPGYTYNDADAAETMIQQTMERNNLDRNEAIKALNDNRLWPKPTKK